MVAKLSIFYFLLQITFNFLLIKCPAYLCAMLSEDIYILDIGNSAVKIACYRNGLMQEVKRASPEECLSFDWKDKTVVLANVAAQELVSEIKKTARKLVEVDSSFSSGFTSKYTSMHTLGIDRLCNVEAMAITGIEGDMLCVDIGTCLKFDFLDRHKTYLGGSISPGIDLRLKSLNDYTARLPLLQKKRFPNIMGDSTSHAILSGVMKGIEAEIFQMISWYEAQYPDLTIFVTGGDASYFDFLQKSNIFADENLTLKGIFSMYNRYAQ
jgi:type III pantothenate kinase